MCIVKLNYMIDWKKRAKKLNMETADRRVWESRCGQYKIEEIKSTFGLSTRYLALAKRDWGWEVVSRHRKRKPAMQALDKSAKLVKRKPTKRKGAT